MTNLFNLSLNDFLQLKQQMATKEPLKVIVQEPIREPGSDSAWEIRELEMKIRDLRQQISSERKRNESLESKIKELTTTIGKERKRCRKVIETLAAEVERLTNLVKTLGRNGHHLNGLKMDHETQEGIKMGSNNHIKTFPISNDNEIKQFCVL